MAGDPTAQREQPGTTMSTSPTISLSQLLSGADAAGHDHALTEKNSGLQHIHNHATGSIVWFPTWQKFRETTDWREAVDGVAEDFRSHIEDVDEWAATFLADDLAILLERAAASGDANVFVQDNLTHHLTRTWAIADAVAEATGKDLPTGGTKQTIFADYPYDVYAQDGGAFATALWNDVIDARRNRALADEAARKALKPVSRKALKNAARKAARR
jgi:hypothetical protein